MSVHANLTPAISRAIRNRKYWNCLNVGVKKPSLFTPICFVLFTIMDLPDTCDHQVGYSAGGYSLSPRWFLP